MEVVIHGAIGGAARLVYQTPNAPSLVVSAIVKDIRRGNNEAPLGQTAYSIEFVSNSCVFTRCIIVRDIQRKAMGYVALSVFIPNHEKLIGTDVNALLDQLAKEYCSRNITENNFNIGKNDCSFVDELIRAFEGRLNPVSDDDTETIPRGTAEAAFAYYSTDEELQKYFSEPYQEEYKPFKQIFFVKSDFEGKPENPLNALRYDSSSNFTGKIDLENQKYTLLYNENSKAGGKIEVRTNGIKRSNKNKIRKKSELEIIYTKPYYREKIERGKWYEINPQFISIDDNKKIITIKDAELAPEEKIIVFEVKNGKLHPIYDAEIIVIGNHNQSKPVINNEVTFIAEEVKHRWTVSGRKGDFSGEKEFTPEYQATNLILILEERKVVNFQGRDNEGQGLVYNCRIQVQNKNINSKGDDIIFIGEEIGRTWNITIYHDDYESKTFSYCPAKDENPKYIDLRKKQFLGREQTEFKNYIVSAGEHGILKNDQEYFSNKADGSDVKDKIVPKKGYKFLGFELGNGILTAQYQKKEPFYKKPTFLAGSLTVSIAIVIILYLALFTRNSNQQSLQTQATQQRKQSEREQHLLLPNDSVEVIEYCNGNELYIPKLRNYSDTFCKDSNSEFCKAINYAIGIRTAINNGRISELKEKNYSSDQTQFAGAVNNIDPAFANQIGEIMLKEKVSEMSLNDVATFIINLQKLLIVKRDISSLQSNNDCDEKSQEIVNLGLPDIEIVTEVTNAIINQKENLNKTVIGRSGSDKSSTPSSNNAQQPSKIIDPAASNPSVKEKNSQLKNQFWSLVKKSNENQTIESYRELLKNFKNKKNPTSEEQNILEYLKEICTSDESFAKLKDIPELTRQKAVSQQDIGTLKKQ